MELKKGQVWVSSDGTVYRVILRAGSKNVVFQDYEYMEERDILYKHEPERVPRWGIKDVYLVDYEYDEELTQQALHNDYELPYDADVSTF